MKTYKVSGLWFIVLLCICFSYCHPTNADEDPIGKDKEDLNVIRVENELRDHFVTLGDGREYYFSNSTKKGWGNAMKHCNEFQMKLVSFFEDDEKIFYVNNYARTLNSPLNQYYWTSGKQTLQSFIWNGIGRIFTNQAWGVGQPNGDLNAQEICVIFDASLSPYENWIDIDCIDTFGYVCEH